MDKLPANFVLSTDETELLVPANGYVRIQGSIGSFVFSVASIYYDILVTINIATAI